MYLYTFNTHKGTCFHLSTYMHLDLHAHMHTHTHARTDQAGGLIFRWDDNESMRLISKSLNLKAWTNP